MPEMSFGRSIRYRRTKLGLSQTRLGELVGRSSAAVRSWERDSSTPTDPSVLQALSAILGIEREALFEKAGVEMPVVETSPTVEEVLSSLTPEEGEILVDLSEGDSVDGVVVEEPEDPDDASVAVLEAEDRSLPESPDDGAPGAGAEDEDEDETGAEPRAELEPVTVSVAAVAPPAETMPAETKPAETKPAASPTPPPLFATPTDNRLLITTPAPPVAEPTYMEDESQRQLYRIRQLATLVVVVGLIVLFVWAVSNSIDALSAWWDDFVSTLQL